MVKEFVIRFCTKGVFKLVGHFQVGNVGGCHFGWKVFARLVWTIVVRLLTYVVVCPVSKFVISLWTIFSCV